jgi:hypothetical protein
MTPDPSSSLVERVAAAMCEATGQPFHGPDSLHDIGELERDGFRHRARAAIRVVVEACAEVCDVQVAASRVMGEPSGLAELCRNRIRNLAPPDTP